MVTLVLIWMLFTAVVIREGSLYVALAPDVDVASHGKTIEESFANLKEPLELHLEDADVMRPHLTTKPIITLVEASLLII